MTDQTDRWISARQVRAAFHSIGERSDSQNFERVRSLAAHDRLRIAARSWRYDDRLNPAKDCKGERCTVPSLFWSADKYQIDWLTGNVAWHSVFQRLDATDVRFHRGDLENVFGAGFVGNDAEPPATAKGANPQHRQRRTSGFARVDQPLVDKMRQLIVAGEATSAWNAAGIVANQAKGSPDNAQRRLADRYNTQFGDDV